jgi:hypothetical protein
MASLARRYVWLAEQQNHRSIGVPVAGLIGTAVLYREDNRVIGSSRCKKRKML